MTLPGSANPSRTYDAALSALGRIITVNVDDALKERMKKHPEINWSEVTRQAIRDKIETLEVMDELTSGSGLTESDVADIADKINESARERVEEESE